jgi:hypothetical protein
VMQPLALYLLISYQSVTSTFSSPLVETLLKVFARLCLIVPVIGTMQ